MFDTPREVIVAPDRPSTWWAALGVVGVDGAFNDLEIDIPLVIKNLLVCPLGFPVFVVDFATQARRLFCVRKT